MKGFLKLILIPAALFTSGCDHRTDEAESQSPDSIISSNWQSQQSTQSFREVDPTSIEQINIELSEGRLSTDEEVMGAYAPKDNNAEGKYSYKLSSAAPANGMKELILVEEGIMDDAVMGRKVIMILDSRGNKMKLISAKESFKCWPGRGHENWTAEPCN